MKTFKEILEKESLNDEEMEVLNSVDDESRHGGAGLIRKLMSSKEIKIANKLVKLGYVEKGTSDDKQKSVQYSITLKGQKLL